MSEIVFLYNSIWNDVTEGCVYISTDIYVCVYVHMHVYICGCKYIDMLSSAAMYIPTFVTVYVTYLCVYIYSNVYMYIYRKV